MAIQKIVKLGNKKLSAPCVIWNQFGSRSLKQLLEDMEDTMIHEKGIGIAAPQLGLNHRIIIFGIRPNTDKEKREEIPFTILINPSIKFLSLDITHEWESRLSVPGLAG